MILTLPARPPFPLPPVTRVMTCPFCLAGEWTHRNCSDVYPFTSAERVSDLQGPPLRIVPDGPIAGDLADARNLFEISDFLDFTESAGEAA